MFIISCAFTIYMQTHELVSKLSWIKEVLQKVWLFLGVLMLISTYLLQLAGYRNLAWLVILLLVATVSYPLYTFGYKLIPSLIGNIMYLLFTCYVIVVVYQVKPVASFFLLPIIVWVSIATVYVIAKIIDKNK